MAETDRALDETADGQGREKLTPTLFLAGCVSALASLLYGYDTGIISAALLQIEEDFGIGHTGEQIVAASILLVR